MTQDEAFLVSAYTGVLCLPASTFHRMLEKRLGRVVMTHEFCPHVPGVEDVYSKFWAELQTNVHDDFMAMLPKENT